MTRAGGTLVVHDRCAVPAVVAWAARVLAVPRTLARRRRRGDGADERAWQAAWDAHDQHEAFLPLATIRRRARRVLPGVRVRRHATWRNA